MKKEENEMTVVVSFFFYLIFTEITHRILQSYDTMKIGGTYQ